VKDGLKINKYQVGNPEIRFFLDKPQVYDIIDVFIIYFIGFFSFLIGPAVLKKRLIVILLWKLNYKPKPTKSKIDIPGPKSTV